MLFPLVRLEGATVGYPGAPVLANVDLALDGGALIGIFGPNGSGKSTLLKTLAGILPPLAGRARFSLPDGRAPSIGYVPQRETLDLVFPLTAAEIVEMGTYGRLPLGRQAGHAERERALACLEKIGAADLRRRLFPVLSGGQKQRVLIARALVAEPDLLLLDEPLNGVDASTAEAILVLLERLNREQRTTIVLVTHHLTAVRHVIREAVWIHAGSLLRGPAATMLAPEAVHQRIEEDFLS